jgi:hypothetical protein
MKLTYVYTPNKVRDAAKMEALTEAYANGDAVRPVIVIEYCEELHALSGSHRIAAMLRAFGNSIELDEIEEYLTVIQADDLDLSERAAEFLDSVRNGVRNESMLADMVGCLPDYAQAAMDDQVG